MKRSKKSPQCPRCSSKDVLLEDSYDGVDIYVCSECDHEFEVGGSTSKNRVSEYAASDEYEDTPVDDDWDDE